MALGLAGGATTTPFLPLPWHSQIHQTGPAEGKQRQWVIGGLWNPEPEAEKGELVEVELWDLGLTADLLPRV